MKKLILFVATILLLVACDDGGSSTSYNPPKEQTSILEFKGLYPQDSGTLVSSKTVDMGKHLLSLSYNNKFTFYDSTNTSDTSKAGYDQLKTMYGNFSSNIKYMATSESNYTTSVMIVEMDGSSETQKALYAQEDLEALKNKAYNEIKSLGFNIKYTFRTTIQGENAVLFKIYSDTNKLYGYAVYVVEDSEKQLFIWGMTKNQNELVDLEKIMSTLYSD